MLESIIINSILTNLELGVIQLWQVSSTLTEKGINSFDNERLTQKITETYEKKKPA